MSIAGIAKEVTTISMASWFFGDRLTPLNIVGVAITVCGAFRPGDFLFRRELDIKIYWSLGICLFTFHKYRKSLQSNLSVDARGNPITKEEEGNDAEGGEITAGVGEENIRLASEADELGEVICKNSCVAEAGNADILHPEGVEKQ